MNKLLGLYSGRYKRRTCLAGVAGFALNLFCTVLFVPSVDAVPKKARSADSFVNTIGVNTHLYYDDNVYHQKYNEIIKPKLLKLGVRHIRDGGTRNLNGYLDRLKQLRSLGIRTTLIFDPRSSTPKGAVNLIKELGNVVEAVEGPNEYDLSGDPNWISSIRTYMQQLHKAVKGDSATANLPVLSPSLTSEDAYKAVGNLNGYVDRIVIHNYYSGRHPGTSGWGPNGLGSIAWNLQIAKYISPTKPLISTETGYHNALNSTSGHRSVPESVAEKYIPRMFLEHFNHGIQRTFIYEFINGCNNPNDLECNFGLLRNDGSEKPTFVALKNLIGLLKNPGPQFTPGVLDYALSGDTTNVHHTLLQKRDGKFYLILWQEVSSFEPNAKQNINVPNQQVTLILNKPIAKATTYLPNTSVNWTSQYTNPRQINLNVPDYPLVVELVPG